MFSFNLKEILSSTMVLFAVIDILGTIPIVVDIKTNTGNIRAGLAALVACAIMIVFLFLGESMLSLLGVDLSSFALAGSLVIFFVALEMILGIRIYKESDNNTASIVPIAFPLIAGAGSLTTLLSIRAEYAVQNIIVAIIINMIFVYIVLRVTTRIEKLLGKGGLNVLRKIFGVVLLAIAIKLFKSNMGIH